MLNYYYNDWLIHSNIYYNSDQICFHLNLLFSIREDSPSKKNNSTSKIEVEGEANLMDADYKTRLKMRKN